MTKLKKGKQAGDASESDESTISDRILSSHTCKTLSVSQLRVVAAKVEILQSGIQKDGSFFQPLKMEAKSFAKAEDIDDLYAEAILRDAYKAICGKTLFATRTELLEREASWPKDANSAALEGIQAVKRMIVEAETMSAFQAMDQVSHTIAKTLEITENGAKRMMAATFEQTQGGELHEHLKTLEQTHHVPVRDAARAERSSTGVQHSMKPSKSRTRS